MQQRSIVRARHLHAFRAALVDLALAADPLAARRLAIVVPTHGAAELLRQAIEREAAARGRAAVLLPDLVTRDEWLAGLHAALPSAPPLLSRLEREVLLARAADEAARRGRMGGRPFRVRPGLVSAMLDFYDELGRRRRTIRRFARVLFDELRAERGTDRGSESLIHQTSFLGFAFLAYERGVAAAEALDEHRLRARLMREQPALRVNHLVVAVADHPSDPRGLWPADFDLAGRLRAITRLDVVVTDEIHDAGLRERLEAELPGIVETRFEASRSGEARLVRPGGAPDALCTISRDREEELRAVARRVRASAARGGPADRIAVVFARPLPYLYLAGHVFQEEDVASQTFDALPLAAEPWAALLDEVLAVARTGGTRDAVVALLRSPLLRLTVDGERVSRRDAAALDAVLAERRAIGTAETYGDEVAAWFGGRSSRGRVDRRRAARAAEAAAALQARLAPFRSASLASAQVRVLSTFLREAGAPPPADGEAARAARARAAVLGVLDALTSAFTRFDDRPRQPDELSGILHHAIEARTFAPRRGRTGVHLVDAVAARFGAFDHVHIVGLVDTDWPERSRRSIFYTSGLLAALGWPQEGERQRAQVAEFRDLVTMAEQTVTLHAFQLEGDAIVATSPMIEAARGLPDAGDEWRPADAAGGTPAGAGAREAAGAAGAWLALRRARPPLDDPRYAGEIAPLTARASRERPVYRPSGVDRYVTCPFKYFAASVLGLPEEREIAAGLTPIERGTILHELFEAFYRQWQADGHGAITTAAMPDAVARFTAIVHERLARLPEPDRVLEQARLLGSIVARGVAERLFELEAEAGGRIVDRLLEADLTGEFEFPALGGLRPTAIAIRAKADRIDVFADGSLRVVDYKLGRQPPRESIQIGVYAHCASQALARVDGRPHPVRAAMYVAFGDDERLAGPVGAVREPVEIAVLNKAGEFAGHVGRIEAGHFPARPLKTSECDICLYAGVCRKEYRFEAGGPAGEEEDEEDEA